MHWSWLHKGPEKPSSQQHVPGTNADEGSLGSMWQQPPFSQPGNARHSLQECESSAECVNPAGHLQTFNYNSALTSKSITEY